MTALKSVAAYFLNCPKCDAGIEEPNTGSFMWCVGENLHTQTVTCACGEVVKIPKNVR